MDFVEVSGVRYVRASDIAKHFGYTADYVGQLSRAGKIDARQIGRAWYVKEGELDFHKGEHTRSNKKKTQASLYVNLRKDEVTTGRIDNTMYVPPPALSEFRKRLLDTSVRYEQDEQPLRPPLDDTKSANHLPVENSHFIQNPAFVERDNPEPSEELQVEEELGEEILEAERPEEPVMHGRLSVEDVEILEEEVQKETPAGHLYEKSLQYVPARPVFHAPSHMAEISPSAHVPVIALGRRTPLALQFPFKTALVALTVALLCIFSGSGLFLHRTFDYSQGSGTEKPQYQTSFGVTEMANVFDIIDSITRDNHIFQYIFNF